MKLALAVLCLALAGCATPPVVYIEREDAARRHTLDGKPGWWLPDATMARLLEKAIHNEEKRP